MSAPLILAVVPLRSESLNVLHGMHWRARASLTRMHRNFASRCMPPKHIASPPPGPLVIKITRIAPRRLDDDNNIGGLKAIRDGIADWLGVPDNDPRVTWAYDQRAGLPKQYAVEVEVMAA